jgi:hypothetical protein
MDMVKKSVYQRPVRMARSRMHNQTGRLVHHHEMLVLEHDVQGDILGFRLKRFRGGHLNQDHLPC